MAYATMVNGVWTDSYTGRPAYYGPNGEPGSGAPYDGGVAYTMPDGRVAYYTPGNFGYADPSRPPNTPGSLNNNPTGGVNSQILAVMNSWLGSVGLSGLSAYVDDLITQGFTDPEAIRAAIEQTDQWKSRFGVIEAQRQAAQAGQPVQPYSPQQVLETEGRLASLMRYYGMPAQFYDHYTDLQNLMLKVGGEPDQVVQVVETSVLKSWQRLNEAPQPVRDVFGQWFGPQGDSMLAAFLMDPDHVKSNLPRMVSAAVAGGYARTYGFDMGKDLSFTLADMGYSDPAQLGRGFGQIAQQADLFAETPFEKRDLQAGVEGVQAAFDLPGGGDATRALQQRQAERAAAFGGRGAGAVTTQQGLTGLGSVE